MYGLKIYNAHMITRTYVYMYNPTHRSCTCGCYKHVPYLYKIGLECTNNNTINVCSYNVGLSSYKKPTCYVSAFTRLTSNVCTCIYTKCNLAGNQLFVHFT